MISFWMGFFIATLITALICMREVNRWIDLCKELDKDNQKAHDQIIELCSKKRRGISE